jgi:hypothetical protein
LAQQGGLSGRLIDWDTWNHFMSRDHIDELTGELEFDTQSAARIQKNLQLIEEQMRGLNPNQQRVAELARATAAELWQFATEIERSRMTRPRLDSLTRSILSEQGTKLEAYAADWSTAAQTYDALASLHASRLRSAPKPSGELTAAIRQIYEDLAAKQRSPKNYIFRPDQIRQRLDVVQKHLAPAGGAP